MKTKNVILAIVAKNDPTRYKIRTVKPEIGKGRKYRPRKKDWNKNEDSGPFHLYIM